MNKDNTFRLSCYFFLVFMTLSFGFILPVFVASLLGFCVIIFLTRWVLNERSFLYLQIPSAAAHGREFFFSYFFGIAICAFSCFLLRMINAQYSWRVADVVGIVVFVVPVQALYEEVLFRSVLQQQLLSRFLKSNLLRALLLGLIFSLSHLVNYRYTAGVNLQLTTLVSLCALGFAGGVLFQFQGNLSGTWGFHAGWNTFRFGVVHSIAGVELMEAQTFDHLEGSLTGILVSLFVVCAVLLWTKSAQSQNPPAKASL